METSVVNNAIELIWVKLLIFTKMKDLKDLKESYEYKLVRQLTAEENRSLVRSTIKRGLILTGICIISLHVFLNAFLWLLKY